ncbi:tRNA-uridine aminocarboxypropyltransferase [Scleromatobacter humisilvae]|uniref:tRNA-uridine aminocarboxypropyltransferase n=1 Tax=Scleromatobacter humisilvae TaxID=2897159 RepID=A0A9X1YH57_9BURK|nr:DTW domain-containing protein [Scleromatobacter humisilvae]MCK9686003.1 DTW domain-containing protein [Scleromatobacter humisilvae]
MNDQVKDAPPHAVARLRATCIALSPTRPRLDRGEPRQQRCAACRLPPSHCACALRASVPTRAGVCLVMSEFESLKPSNTGWLVADVVPDTFAFAWSRTAVDPALLALLADPQWQPVVVFPGEFAAPERVVTELPSDPTRRPLFILLDGTWAEARKAFRKSPYLDHLPVLGLQPEQLSRYQLRRSWHEHHFCTAEVAALCLALAGDAHAAQLLEAWLDVFSDRYLRARQSVAPDPEDSTHRRLHSLASVSRQTTTSP